jgi:plastocyanin
MPADDDGRARLKTVVRHARFRALGLLALAVACSSCGMDEAGTCTPDDADGVLGTAKTFEVTVDDATFTPSILKVQNLTKITLTLTNQGTTPHDFTVSCLPTPNDDGCPTKSCFPKDSATSPVDPGKSITVKFTVPRVEGIYAFRSSVAGDEQKGQLVVQ